MWPLTIALGLMTAEATVADEPPEKLKKLVPKEQQEALTTLNELKKRHEEAKEVSNRLVRQEALEKAREEGEAFKEQLARGMKGWLAAIKIHGNAITLTYGDREKSGRSQDTIVRVRIDLKGVSEDVKQSIRKMEDGDWVTFSVTPADGSNKLSIRSYELTKGKFDASGPGQILTTIRKVGVTPTLKGHAKSVQWVVFSPDGKALASGCGEDVSSARLWDVKSRQVIARFEKSGEGRYVVFTPDGNTLVVPYGYGIRLWDVKTGKVTATLEGHRGDVLCVALSPDGQTAASGSLDRTVRLWDVKSRREIATLTGHTRGVVHVTFSPDGKTLASGSWDETVKLWDVKTGKETATITGTEKPTLGAVLIRKEAAFSPDGKSLALWGCTGSGSIWLWDVKNGKVTATLTGHVGSVRRVLFSPDGKTLASGSWEETVKLWEVKTGKEIAKLTGHAASVHCLAFSPDGNTLATGSRDKTVRLWDVKTGMETAKLTGHTASVHCLAFSPDGNTLATGSEDETIKLWDVKTGEESISP